MNERDLADDAEVARLLGQLPTPSIPAEVDRAVISALRAQPVPLARVEDSTPHQPRRPFAAFVLSAAAGIVGLLIAVSVWPSQQAAPEMAAATVQAGGTYSPAGLSQEVKRHMAGPSPTMTARPPATADEVDACADRMAILAPVEFADVGTYAAQPATIMVTRYLLNPAYIHVFVVSQACDRIVVQTVSHRQA